jgi:hypothetical protein
MASTAKLTHTKALGWYAVQRVRVADWLHPRRDDNEQQLDPETQKAIEKPSKNGSDAQKLRAVVRESHTILAKAKAVFPFQLFPDKVNIDRHKLTIVHRQFFGIEQTVSVPLENIKNVEADFGPFFGSVTITSDLFINNTQTVHFMWRDDAKMIQKLVQGAVVAQRESIDLNKIEIKQLRKMLIDLGSGHSKLMKGD